MTREEAIKRLSTRDAHGVMCGYTSGYQEALDMAVEALQELPKRRKEVKRWKRKALQAEPKHGKWRYFVNGSDKWALCSECGIVSIVGGNYCPNCGAKMDKEVEEHDE